MKHSVCWSAFGRALIVQKPAIFQTYRKQVRKLCARRRMKSRETWSCSVFIDTNVIAVGSSAKSSSRSGGTNLSFLYQASSDGDPTPRPGNRMQRYLEVTPGPQWEQSGVQLFAGVLFHSAVDKPRYLSCILTLADFILDIFLCLARCSRANSKGAWLPSPRVRSPTTLPGSVSCERRVSMLTIAKW